MSDGPDQFAALRESLASSGEPEALRSGLRRAAAELAWTVGRAGQPDRWADLGIVVRASRMETSSGGRRIVGDSEVILVSASEPPERQRFTVAHEIAHSLLSEVPTRLLADHETTERLCNSFAQELLTPAARVRDWVLNDGLDRPDKVFVACRAFGVSVSCMLNGLRRVGLPDDSILIAAEWGAHRNREAVEHYRVRSFAGPPHVYVPTTRRLSSMGLQTLAERAADAPHGARLSGEDERVVVQPGSAARGRRIACFEGPGRWEALINGSRKHVLIRLDASGLFAVDRRGARAPEAGRDGVRGERPHDPM